MLLPQELFAEAIWTEWFIHFGILDKNKIEELLQRCNLKLKKEKNIDDIFLALGRGLKNTYGNTSLQREQIAEEIDKICVIARWDFAVAKYKGQ